jgi:hypothetical protein
MNFSESFHFGMIAIPEFIVQYPFGLLFEPLETCGLSWKPGNRAEIFGTEMWIVDVLAPRW